MVKSPFYVEGRPLTRADELRHHLNELEARTGRLGHGLGREALTIPLVFDTVSTALISFQAEGHSMRAEVARVEAVSAALKRKAPVFLREIGGAGDLEQARRLHHPDPANWWWFLDQLVVDRRQARLTWWLRLAAVSVAILLLLIALYQWLLAPDPATREQIRHQQAAERLASEGDFQGALREVEQALAITPENPHLIIFRGGLQKKLGQQTQAEETFAVAETAFGDLESFLLARGEMYLLLNQAVDAVDDAQAVIARNPDSAAGYMLLGRSYQWLEDYPAAIAAYQQAATLADNQGNFQLAGTARVSAGILEQRLPFRSGGDE
ncbi:MAG: tetratricopeptide repeat protein [Anaerolineales bacterium]|nr:MAG: tetratricopeptide repeat protein [Anaerolineales bacterium]